MKNYQEDTQMGGPSAQDAANIIANVRRQQSMIAEALDKYRNDSVYEGVPRSAAKNLYEINIRN